MAKPKSVVLISLAVLILAVFPCSAKDWELTQRLIPVPTQLDKADASTLIETFSEAFVVQFDDEGELVDLPSWVKQLRYQFDLENEVSPPTYNNLETANELSQFEVARNAIATVRSSGYSLNVIFFVHGWKHNAKRGSHPKNVSNLESFEKLLRVLNERSLTRARENGQKSIYLGVYIGWRGSPWPTLRSLPTYHPIRLLNWLPVNLTFWNRLRAADRISRASLSYVLLSLNAEAKQATYPEKDHTNRNRNHSIIIGHSMGARIVEQTLGQVMVAEIANSALELRLEEGTQSLDSGPVIESLENAIASIERVQGIWLQSAPPSREQLLQDAAALLNIQEEITQSLEEEIDVAGLSAEPISTQFYDTLREADTNLSQLLAASENQEIDTESTVSTFQLQHLSEQLKTHSQTYLLLLKSLKIHLLETISTSHTFSQSSRSAASDHPRIDLVFLLNPANGSILSRQITEAFADPHLSEALSSRKINGNEIPWIISVSSPSDFATSTSYGASSAALWSFRKYRKGQERDQFRYFKKPAPHNDQFRNLELRKQVSSDELSIPQDLQELISLNFNERVLSNWLHANGIPELQNAIVTPEGAYQLSKVEGVQNHPYYWAVLCYDGVIEGHHDIFKQKTAALIAGFLRLSKRFETEMPSPSNETDDILNELQ